MGVALSPADFGAVDANRAVARNFRRARQLRGWTQDEAARRLAPALGRLLRRSSVSAIERFARTGSRRRVFDAHEIVAFAVGFDLPIWWFFMPAGDADRALLDGWGTEVHAGLIAGRVAAVRDSAPAGVVDELLDQLLGPPSSAHRRMSRALAVGDFIEAERGNAAQVTALLRGMIARFEVLADDTRPQPADRAGRGGPTPT